MKLAYVANIRIPTEKAHGIQITKMCEVFADEGIEVELLVPFRKNLIKENVFDYYGVKRNFKIRELYSPDFYMLGKLDKIAFGIKSFISASILFFSTLTGDFDIIYSRDELPLYFLSFFRNNIVFEAHRFSKPRFFFYRRFKKKNLKIIVISQGLEKEFIKFGFDFQNILVAHDGVDLKEFEINDNQQECRSKLGLPLGKKIIGYVGQLKTLGMEKGVDNLIRAHKILSEQRQDLMTIFVGGSKDDIKEHKIFGDKLGIGKEGMLFVEHQDHRLIPFYLKAFDALIMPFPNNPHYAFYMSPLKLFEYMASKRPIIASDLPSIREILNENNSILVEVDNIKALVEGIKKIISDAELATRISQAAFIDVQRYTWRKRAVNILGFIRNF